MKIKLQIQCHPLEALLTSFFRTEPISSGRWACPLASALCWWICATERLTGSEGGLIFIPRYINLQADKVGNIHEAEKRESGHIIVFVIPLCSFGYYGTQ